MLLHVILSIELAQLVAQASVVCVSWSYGKSARSLLNMACELLHRVLQAHGGLDQWNSFETVQATITTGGQLFGMKGTPQDSTPRRMTVATRREWASVTPYGAEDQRTDFTANRIAIERIDGTVITERLRPAEHAEGKAVHAPWDALEILLRSFKK